MEYYLEAFRKYGVFEGRASRSEYWYFTLFNTLVILLMGIAAAGIVATFASNTRVAGMVAVSIISLYILATIVPNLALSIRRLHDTGRSAWWILLSFVPYVGGIILIVLMCLDSQPGVNIYGPNPKEAPPATAVL